MTTAFLTETLKCDRSDPSISEAMFFWTMSSVNAAHSFEIPSVCIKNGHTPRIALTHILQIPMEMSPVSNPARFDWRVLRESICSSSKKRRYDDSQDDADSADPPVIASFTLPVYKTPAPTTKKRKLGAQSVILKENSVAGPSAPRRRATSFVSSAGRAPTLMPSNLPCPSKLRLMGGALTKQSSFGMTNQANPLHLLRKCLCDRF